MTGIAEWVGAAKAGKDLITYAGQMLAEKRFKAFVARLAERGWV